MGGSALGYLKGSLPLRSVPLPDKGTGPVWPRFLREPVKRVPRGPLSSLSQLGTQIVMSAMH